MENLIVDASTGHVGVVSMMTTARPALNPKGVLRSVKGILQDYSGPNISKRQVEGRITSVVPSEVCEYILDNISGQGWDTWRVASGDVFKQSLRNHVERVCSSLQAQSQHQQVQQMPSNQIEQDETKASLLTKALRTVNIDGSVRIDEDSGIASIIDAIRLLCPEASPENAAHMLTRVLEKENADGGNNHVPVVQSPIPIPIADRVSYIKINGHGNITPTCDAKTLIEIIWLLPAQAAKEVRRQSAETICRVLGGDVSLCDEIEQRCASLKSIEEGRTYQNFVMDQGPAKKHRSEPPFWFEYASDEQKSAFVSVVAKKAIALEEIDMHETCKQKLESLGHFAPRDKIEFADRIKDIQRRASRAIAAAPVDNSTISVARPVDDSIDPATGLLIATPKCSESVRGPETSICNEAGKMGIKVGEKAGQVGKKVKHLYSERYGVEAGRNIPKRDTTFRGKPFPENSYWARDADLIQKAIRIVCVPPAKPRQRTTQTLLFAK